MFTPLIIETFILLLDKKIMKEKQTKRDKERVSCHAL